MKGFRNTVKRAVAMMLSLFMVITMIPSEIEAATNAPVNPTVKQTVKVAAAVGNSIYEWVQVEGLDASARIYARFANFAKMAKGHLAVINSDDELRGLRSMAHRFNNGDYAVIGATRENDDSEWQWTDGTAWSEDIIDTFMSDDTAKYALLGDYMSFSSSIPYDAMYIREFDNAPSCGTDAFYRYCSNGTLVIAGTGSISDFEAGKAPWIDKKDKITSIYINKDIKSIGANAFADLTNVQSIYMYGDMPSIGTDAFKGISGANLYVRYPSTGWGSPDTTVELGGGKLTVNDTLYNETSYYYTKQQVLDEKGNKINGLFIGDPIFDSVLCYFGESDVVTVPNKIGKYEVIGVFFDNETWKKVKTLTLPEGLAFADRYQYLRSLEELYFPGDFNLRWNALPKINNKSLKNVYSRARYTPETQGDYYGPQLDYINILNTKVTAPGTIKIEVAAHDNMGVAAVEIKLINKDDPLAAGIGVVYEAPSDDEWFKGARIAESTVDIKTLEGDWYIGSVLLSDEYGNWSVYTRIDDEDDYFYSYGASAKTAVFRDYGSMWKEPTYENGWYAYNPDVVLFDKMKELNNGKANTMLNIASELDIVKEYRLTNPDVATLIQKEIKEGQAVGIRLTNRSEEQVCKAEVFDAVKGKDITLKFFNDKYVWIINGNDITSTKDVDLNVDYFTTGEDESEYLEVDFPENGKLPGKAMIRIKSDFIKNYDTVKDNLYFYYVESNNTNTLIEDAVIYDYADKNDNHWVQFEITHNSAYRISKTELKSNPAKAGKTPTIQNIENTKKGVKLTWAKVKNATGYQVLRKTGKGGWKKVATISKQSTVSYTDKSAKKNNTTYQYKIKAVKKSKDLATSKVKKIVYVTAPKLKSTSKVKDGKMVVKYSKVKKASGYQVSYTLGKKTVTKDAKKATSYTLKSLKSGKKYKIKVRAYIKSGKTKYYSAWS